MKRNQLFGIMAAALATGFVACNNDSDGTASTDTTTVESTNSTTTTTTTTSTSDYAALADSARINSEAGYYLDPKTGKPLKIKVDTQTGQRLNAETGEPVWRYVDNRTWWVYGGSDNNTMWDTVGTARMEKNRVTYRGDNDQWVDYDNRWKSEDVKMEKEWKEKFGDTKIKVSKDGDIKIKDENGKVKYDADDNKIKRDSSK
jgi:hypothetical protein